MTATADQAIAYAMTELGKPYVYGAEGPNDFDCSGLTQWVFAHIGIQLPRTAAAQQQYVKAVPASQARAGDLVFYGAPAHHVGLYLGGGRYLDAPHTGADVRISDVGTPTSYGRVPGLGVVGQAATVTTAALTGVSSSIAGALGVTGLASDIRQIVYEGAFAVLGLVLVGAGVYAFTQPKVSKIADQALGAVT